MVMNSNVIIFNESFESSDQLTLESNTICFHGASVDDRGNSALSLININPENKIGISYDFDEMLLSVDEHTDIADKVNELISPYVTGDIPIILEATTLGFPELFLCIKALIDLEIKKFSIVYIEPSEYNRTNPSADSFALSELNAGYKPIPNAIVDLAGEDVEAGVFFLGYEQNRLERAFEEYQMITNKELKLIFGIPAFKPGWELNSIVPHLPFIKDYHVSYCAANDPSSALECLEATLESINADNKMFIAPIGTKPCGIASALFASLNPHRVGLLYDHRKKKEKRSKGVSTCHRYVVNIK